MEPTAIDNQITNCYVDAYLCVKLHDAGMTAPTTHFWKTIDQKFYLETFVFDDDDYYKNLLELNSVNPQFAIPAFSLTDCEKVLPPYMLTREDEDGYKLGLSTLYTAEICKAERMPDVFAKMVLQGIKKSFLSVDKINKILSLIQN